MNVQFAHRHAEMMSIASGGEESQQSQSSLFNSDHLPSSIELFSQPSSLSSQHSQTHRPTLQPTSNSKDKPLGPMTVCSGFPDMQTSSQDSGRALQTLQPKPLSTSQGSQVRGLQVHADNWYTQIINRFLPCRPQEATTSTTYATYPQSPCPLSCTIASSLP